MTSSKEEEEDEEEEGNNKKKNEEKEKDIGDGKEEVDGAKKVRMPSEEVRSKGK